MIKYSFPQFKTVVVNPTVSNIKVNDNISLKECLISCTLIDPSGSMFGISLPTFHYDDTWTDSDIEEYINSELKKVIVPEEKA
jgi:hypothetical protein